jgi:hypothetical protein
MNLEGPDFTINSVRSIVEQRDGRLFYVLISTRLEPFCPSADVDLVSLEKPLFTVFGHAEDSPAFIVCITYSFLDIARSQNGSCSKQSRIASRHPYVGAGIADGWCRFLLENSTFSAGHEIIRLLSKSKVHFRVYKNPPPGHSAYLHIVNISLSK